MVEFSDLICKSSSNFKSIGWKLRILEIPPSLLTLGYVDLLVDVDLKNNWLVEFSERKYKSSSNFKSIGWKLRILEMAPKLTFWPMLTSNILVCWIKRPGMPIFFKGQVNWMKIEDFRNSTLVVDLGTIWLFGRCWP